MTNTDTKAILDRVAASLRAVDEELADPVDAISEIFSAVAPGVDAIPIHRMSLRDWFAGQAARALIELGSDRARTRKAPDGGDYDFPDAPYYFGFEWDTPYDDNSIQGCHSLAVDCYTFADAMIRERNRPR